MRQATLAFGHRRAAVDNANALPSHSSGQGHKRKAPDSAKSDAGPSSSSKQNGGRMHPMFARQEAEKKIEKPVEAVVQLTGGARIQGPKVVPTLFRKRPQPAEAPWPSKGESHVQPEEDGDRMQCSSSTHFETVQAASKKGTKLDESDSTVGIVWPWQSTHSNGSTAFEVYPTSHNITDAGTTPAIPKRPSHTSQLWTDASRPRKSNEVLGNEAQAAYIRDWLRVLQITGGATMLGENGEKQIIKRVLKKRGRPSGGGGGGEMDDFIVGDTEEEEAWFDQFRRKEESTGLHEEAEDSSEPVADGYDLNFANASHLTNLIVLHGPSGSGKTAAVYACADELGFEVFEIYAGMGKRSGHSVMSLVGDLCLNHMVSSGGTGGGAFKTGKAERLNFSQGQNGAANPVDPSVSGKPRQSLVLFEEVDILYEDDKGFWPAMVELAAQSRRPIILTCNDLASIPLADLPIQRVLEFASPTPIVAIAYMQQVAAAQGQHIDAHLVSEIYQDRVGLADRLVHDEELVLKSHGLLHPSTVLRFSQEQHLDLRKALMQLQFYSAKAEEDRRKEEKCQEGDAQRPPPTLRRMIAVTELRSSGDVISARSHSRSTEILEPEQYGPSSDDVQSYAVALHKSAPTGNEVALAGYGREEEIADFLMLPSKRVGNDADGSIGYHERRLQMSSAVNDLCERLMTPLCVRPPNDEAVLETIGIVHKIVRADDDDEYAHKTHVAQLIEKARKVQQAAMEAENGSSNATMASAAAGLARAGIRSSRHSSRLLLQRDENGVMQLGRREPEFFRWVMLEEAVLAHIRTFAPSIDW